MGKRPYFGVGRQNRIRRSPLFSVGKIFFGQTIFLTLYILLLLTIPSLVH